MSLAKPFTIVGSATLLSRVSGFVRDILIAALLGTSAVADIYVAAFLVPNLIRRMMSEGALNAAIVPRLARLEQQGGLQAARGYSDDVISLLSVVAIVLVLIAEIFMPQLMAVLAHGFASDTTKFADAVLFARIAFPFVGFTLIVAVMAALLNSVEKYAIAALVPVVLNILLIGVMVALMIHAAFDQRQAGLILVTTVLAAGFIQFVLLWVAAWKAGFDVCPRPLDALRGRIDPGAKTLLLLALPAMMIAGSGHVHMIIASLFASFEPRGMALLYFADRLFQLPLGFVASAMGVVLLPRVSRALQQGDQTAMASAQSEGLLFASLLVLPAATGLYVLADPIISVLFQRAAFTAADGTATAANLRILALALPAFVMVKIILPAFLARETMRWPVLAVLAAFGVNIGTVLWLQTTLPHLAPVIGVAAGAWTNALLLVVAVFGNFALTSSTLPKLMGACVATMIMGVTVAFLAQFSAQWLAPEHVFALKGAVLGVICVSGIVIFIGLAALFGALNLRMLRSDFSKR